VDLDPEFVKALLPKAKKQLRVRMKALRGALPAAARSSKSAHICRRVAEHPAFAKAQRVALFWPVSNQGEVDVRPLDTAARTAGKVVYYPFMDAAGDVLKTGFRPVRSPDDLSLGEHGFKEPPRDAPDARPGDLDLLILPALAVSENGHRLGYGSGFYDATAPEFSPPATLLAVAFDFQLLAEVPSDAHDIPAHIIITDQRTLSLRE
jgi:5-formyltetrahydrofolate cyclo-ligase